MVAALVFKYSLNLLGRPVNDIKYFAIDSSSHSKMDSMIILSLAGLKSYAHGGERSREAHCRQGRASVATEYMNGAEELR